MPPDGDGNDTRAGWRLGRVAGEPRANVAGAAR